MSAGFCVCMEACVCSRAESGRVTETSGVDVLVVVPSGSDCVVKPGLLKVLGESEDALEAARTRYESPPSCMNTVQLSYRSQSNCFISANVT
jgi:hypothetical protein